MDWQNVLWIVLIVAAVFLMMRGCGGMMMGGGCGMPRHRDMKNNQENTKDETKPTKAA